MKILLFLVFASLASVVASQEPIPGRYQVSGQWLVDTATGKVSLLSDVHSQGAEKMPFPTPDVNSTRTMIEVVRVLIWKQTHERFLSQGQVSYAAIKYADDAIRAFDARFSR